MSSKALAVGLAVGTAVVALLGASTPAVASDETRVGGGDRDQALVSTLVYHRSDVPSHWLSPQRDRFPCTPARRPGIDTSARREAGWIETGNTLIHRVMWSRVETSDTPDALFRHRIKDVLGCLGAEKAAHQPRLLVDAPAGITTRLLYATGPWRGNSNALEIVVVQVGRAVAQYAYAWVRPPYHASGLAIVRRAVARGISIG